MVRLTQSAWWSASSQSLAAAALRVLQSQRGLFVFVFDSSPRHAMGRFVPPPLTLSCLQPLHWGNISLLPESGDAKWGDELIRRERSGTSGALGEPWEPWEPLTGISQAARARRRLAPRGQGAQRTSPSPTVPEKATRSAGDGESPMARNRIP